MTARLSCTKCRYFRSASDSFLCGNWLWSCESACDNKTVDSKIDLSTSWGNLQEKQLGGKGNKMGGAWDEFQIGREWAKGNAGSGGNGATMGWGLVM